MRFQLINLINEDGIGEMKFIFVCNFATHWSFCDENN